MIFFILYMCYIKTYVVNSNISPIIYLKLISDREKESRKNARKAILELSWPRNFERGDNAFIYICVSSLWNFIFRRRIFFKAPVSRRLPFDPFFLSFFLFSLMREIFIPYFWIINDAERDTNSHNKILHPREIIMRLWL